VASAPALAVVPYFEGFEAGWVCDTTAATTWAVATQAASGTGGITSYAGSFHGLVTASTNGHAGNGPGWGSGESPPPPYSDSGNRMNVWDASAFQSWYRIDAVYIDNSWSSIETFAAGYYQEMCRQNGTESEVYGFEFGSADPNGANPGTIFWVGDKDPDSTSWELQANYWSTQTGWYQLVWEFFEYDNAGTKYVAAYEWLIEPDGTIVSIEDRNTGTQRLGGTWLNTVAGAGVYDVNNPAGTQASANLYTLVGIDSLAIDNTTTGLGSAPPIPEPASLALLALGGLAMLRRRR